MYDSCSNGELEYDEFKSKEKKLNKLWSKTRMNFFAGNKELTKFSEQLFMSAYLKYCATKGKFVMSPINLATLYHFEHANEDDLNPYNNTDEDLSPLKRLIDNNYFELKKEGLSYYFKATKKATDFCENNLIEDLLSTNL